MTRHTVQNLSSITPTLASKKKKNNGEEGVERCLLQSKRAFHLIETLGFLHFARVIRGAAERLAVTIYLVL